MPSVVNEPRYSPSTHAHAQSTPMSLYHEKTWRKEQTSGRGRIGGAKKRPGVASGHTASPRPTTKEQVCGLDKSDQDGHPVRDSNRQGSREHYRTSWAPRDGHPFRPPFSEQTTRPPGSGKEQAINSNHQRLPERPGVNDKHHQDCAQWHQHEYHCLPASNAYLPLRFLSGRPWGIQRQWFCLAILPQTRTSISSNK